MSKFENEQEKKVREILTNRLNNMTEEHCTHFDDFDWLENTDKWIESQIDGIMLRIRPFLRVQKKWMGDCL